MVRGLLRRCAPSGLTSCVVPSPLRPSPATLPSLQSLELTRVTAAGEEQLIALLSASVPAVVLEPLLPLQLLLRAGLR